MLKRWWSGSSAQGHVQLEEGGVEGQQTNLGQSETMSLVRKQKELDDAIRERDDQRKLYQEAKQQGDIQQSQIDAMTAKMKDQEEHIAGLKKEMEKTNWLNVISISGAVMLPVIAAIADITLANGDSGVAALQTSLLRRLIWLLLFWDIAKVLIIVPYGLSEGRRVFQKNPISEDFIMLKMITSYSSALLETCIIALWEIMEPDKSQRTKFLACLLITNVVDGSFIHIMKLLHVVAREAARLIGSATQAST
eukprot:c54262_g1_i1.p1 GENE.c54262_g1_i1~~c54262_g1_i1.p1  ORF type:complete len:251 (+),score=31.35 c54262_g1_i1:64-816(+)